MGAARASDRACGGWRGRGRTPRCGFCSATATPAADVAAHVRAAAEVCAALRDDLWRRSTAKSRRQWPSMSAERRSGRHGWPLPLRHAGAGDHSAAQTYSPAGYPIRGQRHSQRLAGRDASTRRDGGSYDTAIHALTSTPECIRDSRRAGPDRQPVAGEPVSRLRQRRAPAGHRKSRCDGARRSAGPAIVDERRSRSHFRPIHLRNRERRWVI